MALLQSAHNHRQIEATGRPPTGAIYALNTLPSSGPLGILRKKQAPLVEESIYIEANMKNKLLSSVLLLLVSFAGHSTAFATCSADTLDDVSENGEILQMVSGEIYKVNPGDAASRRKARGWSAPNVSRTRSRRRREELSAFLAIARRDGACIPLQRPVLNQASAAM